MSRKILPLLSIFAALCTSWLLLRPSYGPAPATYDFSLIALSTDGQPIAGARVYLQKQEVGITDSFGRWQKTQAMTIDKLLHVSVEKTSADSQLVGSKNFILAELSREDGAILIHHNIILQPKGTALRKKRGQFPRQDDSLHSLWFQLAAPKNSSPLAPQHYRYLEKSLLPALTQLARSLKLQVEATSPWQLSLSTLVMPEGTRTPALLRVVAQHPNAAGPIDFLVPITGSVKMIAEEIFKKLQFHIDDQFTARGWQQFTLHIEGVQAQQAEVYIAGFKAEALKPSVWQYWGRNNQQANLAIVENGRLTYRQRILMGKEEGVFPAVRDLARDK
jgi:hypothetical protein